MRKLDLYQTREEVLDLLRQNQIMFEYHEHERAHTIDDCLKMPFITEDVTICKNILLCNRQQTVYYLLLLKPLTPFRTSVVSKLLGSSRLSFAPEDTLEKMLHLTSGSVSPLGLLFDQENRIQLCYEKGITDTERIAFHPCDNHATVIFSQHVFWNQVIPALNIKYPVCIDLSEKIDETQGNVVK